MAGMNMQQMMKQARKMQEQLAAAQENLKSQTVDASAGGGMVKVTISGKNEMRKISIDPSLMVAEDVEVLEDLIVAAFNDAKAKVEAVTGEEMQKVTGGISLPGGLKLPF